MGIKRKNCMLNEEKNQKKKERKLIMVKKKYTRFIMVKKKLQVKENGKRGMQNKDTAKNGDVRLGKSRIKFQSFSK